MERISAPNTEVIDLADIFRSIRNRWKLVAGVTAVGILVALGIILFAPVRFAGVTSVVLKTGGGSGPSGTLAAALGALSEAGGGGLSGLKSGIETEVDILQSRAIAAEVVDSLGLQVQVVSPRAFPASRVVAASSLPDPFREISYRFTAVPGAEPRRYRFEAKERADTGVAVVGTPTQLAVGSITLAATAPSEGFTLKLRDREDAITRMVENLDVGKVKSEVAQLKYTADDSLLAADVPNLVLDRYLQRRRGIDRGTNQRRAEFLAAKVDSVGQALTRAESALRAQREGSGVIDPLTMGRVGLENENRFRNQLTELRVQEGALRSLLAEISSGKATPRSLAAYPAYLGSGAISNIVSNLIAVETERQGALQIVTEADIGVRTLNERARGLEAQLIPLAQSTLSSIESQRVAIEARLDSTQKSLLGLPGAAETYGRLERDIIDKAKIYALLQAQLVDARLAAISEGGDVRGLDQATVPKYRKFPKKKLTLAAGMGGGLIAGLFLAAFLGVAGGAMHDPVDIERRTGLPAVRFEATAPLLVGGQTSRTVLVAPINGRAVAGPVASRLVETALARSMTATILDLTKVNGSPRVLPAATGAVSPEGPLTSAFDANAAIARLEENHDLVVVQLPELNGHAAAAVLSAARPVVLVAPERRIDQGSMRGAVDLLRRVGAPCAGVVLNGDDRKTLRG